MRTKIKSKLLSHAVDLADDEIVEARTYNAATVALGQGPYHLAVIDLYLPDLNPEEEDDSHGAVGLDLIETVRNRWSSAVIVAITAGRDDLAVSKRATEAGATYFIQKGSDHENRVYEEAVQEALGKRIFDPRRHIPTDYLRSNEFVFLVHGRDNDSAERVRNMLVDEIKVKVHTWTDAINSSRPGAPIVLDVVLQAIARCRACVVLFTPDEYVELRGAFSSGSSQVGLQSRPNVYFEAGAAMMLSRVFGFIGTIFVVDKSVRTASDLEGVHYLEYGSDNLADEMKSRLQALGFSV